MSDYRVILASDKEHEKKVTRLVDRIGRCIEKLGEYHLDDSSPPRLIDLLRDCAERTGKKSLFVMEDELDLSEQPPKTLLIPNCKESSIMTAVSVAKRCHTEGNQIETLIFVTDSPKRTTSENLELAWELADDYGVKAIALLPLVKEVITRWRAYKG